MGPRIAPAIDLTTEEVGPGEWLANTAFSERHEPFEEYCNYTLGMMGQIPTVYGLPPAHVVEETCQRQGAPVCRFRVRWEPQPDTAEPSPEFLARRLRILETRLLSLQETVGELVSGDSLESVLGRVIDAASRAVLAPRFMLALEPLAYAPQRIYATGLPTGQLARPPDELLAETYDADAGWLAVDVASTRRRYGRLAAAHDGEFLPHDRVLLEAYARLAAAALDSAASLEEARRQAATANALLELSRALAEIGTTEEVVRRLAEAVPAVVDCDQVVVTLPEEEGRIAAVAAIHNVRPELGMIQEGHRYPIHRDQNVFSAEVIDLTRTATPAGVPVPGAAAIASVPLVSGSVVLGWVTALVADAPERLTGDPHIAERLQGVAGLAATALRNAQLVDEIRYQALHDSLTGLANQRLLQEHAETALARARRLDERVGLLFLDLDAFKSVNDTHGHTGGDDLLQQVAHRVRSVLRESDTAARFGGDEFVILLPDLRGDGSAVMGKIAEALSEPFLVRGTPVTAGASLGLAVAPEDGDTYAALLSVSDKRMYEVKSDHRS